MTKKPLLRVFRVRTLFVAGAGGSAVQAVVYVVAPDRAAIPALVFKAQPALAGAALEVLDEYTGTDPLWPVRIGTGEPQRYLAIAAPRESAVKAALLAYLPADDHWRRYVEDGWFEVRPAINRTKKGVY